MITRNYIKKCEKAEEIQKNYKWKKGDNGYFLGYTSPSGFMRRNEHFIFGTEEFEDTIESWWSCIWLPTQEQLQEMINWKNIIKKSSCNQTWKENFQVGVILIELIDFYKFAINRQDNMNELWLAFVMKEKYNKIWDGNKWK